ncbi:MAG: uncharacterized protein V7607_4995 [Solirubrobacteraceae bacterium]
MRDGVILRADVFRPDGPGRWPTLLARTPYDKSDHRQAVWCGLDPVQTARRGFVVVMQDTRGRFASDGLWEPFRFERLDGYDSVEWAARLPGSNGRVGMFSASYCANTQWLAAAERPPSLGAIAPALTWSDPMDGLFARGGAVELGLAMRWTLENGFDHLRRVEPREAERRRRAEVVMDEWDRLGEDGYWHLPVDRIAALHGQGLPDLGGIGALSDPEIAEHSRVTSLAGTVEIPSHHTAGWYDIFLQGTLDNYGAAAAAGRETRLIIGPWTHHAFADPVGQSLFGMRAGRDGVPVHELGDWKDLQLAWLRRHLADEDIELPAAPVRIFVMGRNTWRDEAAWPPPATVERWFLDGDGSVGPSTPHPAEQTSAFAYDPANPVPTVGGHGVLSPGYPSGPFDQASIEEREDVLVYTSEPLRCELEVTGRVRVVLHAQSTARSTDWVGRLCDVHPDGRSMNLCDGILRVADGANRPGRHEIDLWSTSNVFLPGHRLRVHVTSSSFPRWDRNLSTGDQRKPQHEGARQSVSHAAERPSFIELPVIANGAR